MDTDLQGKLLLLWGTEVRSLHLGRILQLSAALVAAVIATSGCAPTSGDPAGTVTTSVPASAGPSTSSTTTSSTTQDSTTTTSAPPSSITSDVPRERVIYEVPFPEVESDGGEWEEALYIEYGLGDEQVGNGVALGEEYGPYEPVALDSEGFWWVADVYKSRLSRYDGEGEYIDSVPTSELSPMAGMVALEDGYLLATTSGNEIAVISAAGVTLHSAGGAGNPTLIDGYTDSAYGFGPNGVIYRYTREGETLVVERDAEHYKGADGGEYRFGAVDLNTLQVSLVGERAVVEITPVPDDNSETEVAIGEPIRDKQGRTHILIYGTSFGSPDIQRGVYVRLNGTELETTAHIPDIFSGWGWSLLTNLGIDQDDNALLTGVDPDGVRVWRYNG